MAEVKLGEFYKVEVMEYERGWGSRCDEIKYFDSEESAKAFCADFNKENTATTVPDWYMVANYCGKVK